MSENKNKLPPGYKIQRVISNGCSVYAFINPLNAILQKEYCTTDLEKLISYAWEDYEMHKEAIRLNALSEIDYRHLT